MDDDALNLFGQIISANVAATQWATDTVIENEQREKKRMAQAFVLFYDAVNAAAAVSTTRKLEYALGRFAEEYDNAVRILDKDNFS